MSFASLGTPVKDVNNEGTTIAFNVTAPAGSTALVWAFAYNPGVTVTLAGAGLDWTQVLAQDGGTGDRHGTLFVASVPDDVSAQAVTATYSGAAFGRAIFGAYVAGDHTVADSVGLAGPGPAWAVDLDSANGDAAIVGAWYDGPSTDNTPDAGSDELLDFNNTTNASWAVLQATADGPVTLSGVFGAGPSAVWEVIAVGAALRAASGGGGGLQLRQGDAWVDAARVTRAAGAWG